MAGLKPNIYALLVTCLGFLCLVISATAVGVPIWAYYDSRGGGKGHLMVLNKIEFGLMKDLFFFF